MPDERDRRRLITPPAGVREQTAPESWEGPGNETPAPQDPTDALHVISRRVKITAQSAQATLDEIGKLRGELDEMRQAGARREGTLEEIKAQLEEERKERRLYTAVGVSAYQASVDTEVKRALAKIELEKAQAAATIVAQTERAAYWRAVGLKVLAAIAVLWIAFRELVLTRH